jgi:pilus assembly protein CpaE
MAIIAQEADREFALQVIGADATPHIIVGSPLDAVSEFAKRTFSPNYLFLDIGERGADVLPEIDKIAEYCEPGTRVVVIGLINDVNFYRELKERGVSEYFIKPARPDAIREVLYYKQEENTGAGEVISVMCAASGDGASTVAINTAYALATEYNKTVVLVDMDYQFGMIAKNLDLTTQFGIKEMFDNPDRGIDSALIERVILQYKDSRLSVISAPNQLHFIPQVPDEFIYNLITTLSNDYDFVIIDLPHVWNPLTSACLSQSNHIVMVGQLWLRSITHSSRLLNAWRKIGIKDKQISLVANRSGAKFKEAVSAGDFERVCGLSFRAQFDNDTKSVIAAENNGRTILEGQPCDLSRQFKKFAAQISHNQWSDGKSGDGSPKSRFSLIGKK